MDNGSIACGVSPLLSTDIVEAILMGEEPSGLSLTILSRQLPVEWGEQRAILGFASSGFVKKTP